jgi:ABC-2 type transport system permease protein
MSINRIKGLMLQELFISLRSLEVIFDFLIFPIMSIIVFGFLALFLSGSGQNNIANSLLTGMLLWEIIFIIQYSVSVESLWNIWSDNLSNMFIAPISLFEYIFAQSLSGILKAIIIFIPASFLSYAIFHFNIYQLGAVNLLLYFVNLTLFSLSMGLVILGLIFRYGTRIQSFAWGILPILQPLTAAFYPVSVLPGWLQTVAWLLPPTYIFEAARASLSCPCVQWRLIGISFVENIIYFIMAIWLFNLLFRNSKKTGQFAKLES